MTKAIQRSYLYMATTTDRFEWPVAVAENPFELDKLLGRCHGWTLSTLAHNKKSPRKRSNTGKQYLHVYKIEVSDP